MRIQLCIIVDQQDQSFEKYSGMALGSRLGMVRLHKMMSPGRTEAWHFWFLPKTITCNDWMGDIEPVLVTLFVFKNPPTAVQKRRSQAPGDTTKCSATQPGQKRCCIFGFRHLHTAQLCWLSEHEVHHQDCSISPVQSLRTSYSRVTENIKQIKASLRKYPNKERQTKRDVQGQHTKK